MKIGINASFARKPDSGTGQVTLNFLKKLSELKTDEHRFVLYLEEDLPKNFTLPKNFEKKVFLPIYRRDDLIRKVKWERKMLPKKVDQDGCDVLLSLYQSATVTKKTKHIMLVHDVVWKIFPKYLNNIRKKIYYKLVEKAIQKADTIVTVSQNSKKDIVKFCEVPEKKVKIFPIDCDPIFKKDIDRGKKGDYIFYVGGFDLRKNIRNLIDGYAMFWKRYHKEMKIPKLALAGSFRPNLVPLITDIPGAIKYVNKKYGCPEKMIELIGFVKQKNLPVFYQNARLFCYPSLYEGFGLPILEAMNCGCPIITSNVSSIPEIVSDREATLIDPRQSEDIAKAMHLLLTDKKLAQEKIVMAKKRAEKYSWDIFAKSMLEEIIR